jgi:hypothetical protein
MPMSFSQNSHFKNNSLDRNKAAMGTNWYDIGSMMPPPKLAGEAV